MRRGCCWLAVFVLMVGCVSPLLGESRWVLVKARRAVAADDPAWLALLARTSGVEVEAGRAMSPQWASYVLHCVAPDAGCEAALARLRAAPEIEAATPDTVKSLP